MLGVVGSIQFQDLLQVHFEPHLETFGQKLQGHCLERKVTSRVVLGRELVPAAREELLGVDTRHVSLLFGRATVSQCLFHDSFLQVVLPSILILTLQVGDRDGLFREVNHEIVGSKVHLNASNRLDCLEVVTVHDFAGDLRNDSQVSRVLEHDVEQGDGEA